MATLHSWLNTQPDKISQRFYFTHIYIPFILSLFNYIQDNGELRCFELIWFLYWIVEKSIGLYQPCDLYPCNSIGRIHSNPCYQYTSHKVLVLLNRHTNVTEILLHRDRWKLCVNIFTHSTSATQVQIVCSAHYWNQFHNNIVLAPMISTFSQWLGGFGRMLCTEHLYVQRRDELRPHWLICTSFYLIYFSILCGYVFPYIWITLL